jgi:hypothetical protein
VPTINSPLGSKKVAGGMREFVVDEEEANPQYQHQNMHYHQPSDYVDAPPSHPQFQQPPPPQAIHRSEIKRVSPTDNSKISEAGRKRIELLCGMTQLVRQVTIGENVFELRTLKTKENREVITSSLKFDGTIEFSFELRKQVLARSLVSVAGIDIESFVGSFDFNAKLDFVDELDDTICERLYSEYLDLNKETKEKFGFKTDAELSQVGEEIKK